MEVRFCRACPSTRGGPICLDPLSPEAQAHRGESFRVELRGGKISRASCVNGAGGPCAEQLAETFRYEGGALAEQTTFGAYDVPLGTFRFRALPDGRTRRAFVSLAGDGESAVEIVSWDARGRMVERLFVDPDDRPRLGAEGAFGVRFHHDEAGRVVGMDFVDAGGRPMLARGGVARWRYELDAHGESVAAEGLDLEGQLVRRGLARTVWSRDDWGNLLRTAFFDAQGAPALDAGRGAATVAVRDDHGLLRALRLLDARGAPYLGSDGHAGYGFSYDAAGRRLALTYVDVAGRPTRAAGGFARATYRYDDRGRLVEERRYDEAGELVITPAGFAIAAHRYNDAGDEILTLFLGPHGGPMIGEGIASGIAQAYDAAHRLLGYAFLDERGKPRDIWRGYAVVRHAYDASGRRVRTERLDSGGEPAQVLDLRLLRVAFGVPGSRSRDDARARADEALRRVRRGLPFADALRQYGDGSEQPATVEISAGMLQPELAKAARALAPGEVSEVIETLQGFFVLQRAK